MALDAARRPISAVLALSLIGCAVTHQHFSSVRSSMSNEQVCDASVDSRKGDSLAFMSDTYSEVTRRGMTVESCEAMVAEKKRNAAMLVAVLAGAALAVSASKGGGAAAPSAWAPTAVDTDWAWDQFYGPNFQLMWACRGIQTGQFADQWRCQYKIKVDSRWPGLSAP